MTINFGNIDQHIIPIEDFRLKWRFTDEEYDQLPDENLQKLQPLDSDAAQFLWDYIAKSNLHNDFPFKKGYFQTVEQVTISADKKPEIKEWLSQKEFVATQPVFLSWSPTDAMIVPWEILIQYFDCFYYESSDDLTVFEQNLDWALLFFHEGKVYFGTNNT